MAHAHMLYGLCHITTDIETLFQGHRYIESTPECLGQTLWLKSTNYNTKKLT